VQGGKALGGFLSGFAGSLFGGFAKDLDNVDTITKTIMVAVAGGIASMLGGGKFANGAMSAAFIFMFNEMAGYPKKFLTVTKEYMKNQSVKFYMQRYGISRTDAEALRSWRIELDRQHMNKTMDVAGLGLSVASSISPPAVAIRLGLVALGIDFIQYDKGGVVTGTIALPHYASPYLNYGTATLDIGYSIFQVFR